MISIQKIFYKISVIYSKSLAYKIFNRSDYQTMTILDVFKSRLQGAKRVLISTHEFPDADGIGSEISLCLALRELGLESFCVNEVPLLERYHYLDQDKVVWGLEDFKIKFSNFSPDLIIIVDTNTIERIGKELKKYILNSKQPLFIDHHPYRGKDIHNQCIDTQSAATGQIVGELIIGLGIKLHKKIALPIYTAIIIDTSSFRYPTVSSNTHALIAKLMSTGINPPEAYNGIYGTKKVQHMHLLSKILGTANTNKDETIAWITFNKTEIDAYLSDVEDTHSFINNLLILNNIKVACMFRDDGEFVKLSLRSSGEYDVGEIASILGGGGHSHSAATIFKKKKNESLENIVEKAVSDIETILNK
jgi:phosphoesterase RecJ-like protein